MTGATFCDEKVGIMVNVFLFAFLSGLSSFAITEPKKDGGI
jgi:hypothetical protein